MSIWADKDNIRRWIQEACNDNQVPDLALKIKFVFNDKFRNRMGDAQGHLMLLRLSAILWLRATPAQKIDVVKHETCHLITWHKYGKVKSHGDEWKRAMVKAGLVPMRTHAVKTPKRSVKVQCLQCQNTYDMGMVRARRMKLGTKYLCKTCSGGLVFVP